MVAAAGAGRDGRRDRARRRDRRGLPAGHREPPVRVRPRRQRLADAARRSCPAGAGCCARSTTRRIWHRLRRVGAHGRRHPRALRRRDRRVRRQRAARPDRLDLLRAGQGVHGPRHRRERLPPRRQVRRRPVLRSLGQARPRRARARGGPRLHPRLARQAPARPRRGRRRARRPLGPGRPRPARGPRPRARRPRPLPGAQGGRQGRQRPHDELDDRALPDARLGQDRLPRPRRRGGARAARRPPAPRLPARRGGPGRRLALARGLPRRDRRAPERAAASTPCTTRARAPT